MPLKSIDMSVIDDRDHVIIKAGDGTRPVGILLLDKRTGEIGSLLIDNDYRNRGIAKGLIGEAERYHDHPWIKVTLENKTSQNLARKLGYREMVLFEKKQEDRRP
jgi:ribosomal protein S18 acetylase RimI-like enzyme